MEFHSNGNFPIWITTTWSSWFHLDIPSDSSHGPSSVSVNVYDPGGGLKAWYEYEYTDDGGTVGDKTTGNIHLNTSAGLTSFKVRVRSGYGRAVAVDLRYSIRVKPTARAQHHDHGSRLDSPQDVLSLMKSKAYGDPSHADHQRTFDAVKTWFEDHPNEDLPTFS